MSSLLMCEMQKSARRDAGGLFNPMVEMGNLVHNVLEYVVIKDVPITFTNCIELPRNRASSGFLGKDWEAEWVDFIGVQRSAENTWWAGASGGQRIWAPGDPGGGGEGPSEASFGTQLWCRTRVGSCWFSSSFGVCDHR